MVAPFGAAQDHQRSLYYRGHLSITVYLVAVLYTLNDPPTRTGREKKNLEERVQ
jgi:hypothetical protein